MTLRLAGDEIEEIRRALASAHCEVIRELAQTGRIGADPTGVQLCRRKWKLEAMLRQIESPGAPAPVLEIVPRQNKAALERAAA